MSEEVAKVKKDDDVKNVSYYIPRVDVSYNEQETLIVADMPGVDNEGVDVSVDGDVLTVTGTTNINIPEGFNLKWNEYKMGNYRKSFKMTESVDVNNISAVMKDGVLQLKLPNKKQAIPLKIKVKSA